MSGGPPPLPLLNLPGWLAALTAPAWGTGGSGPPGSATNPLTAAQATALFHDMQSKSYIPFNYPDDGCYARAHEMCRLMQGQHLACDKVWIYASGYPYVATLGVDTPNAPGVKHVDWIYHVAPIVQVQGPDGKPVSMVIDPSISAKPLTEQEWKDKMADPGAKLEHSDSSAYQRGPAGTEHDFKITDDDYSKTNEILQRYSEERDNRLKAESGNP